MNGKKIISLLDALKKLVISKCIPDDEEMKQPLQISQEQATFNNTLYLIYFIPSQLMLLTLKYTQIQLKI